MESDDTLKIQSQVHATIYKVETKKGSKIKAGDVLVVLESMKMEINIVATSEHDGQQIGKILVGPGDVVKPGDALLILSGTEEEALA